MPVKHGLAPKRCCAWGQRPGQGSVPAPHQSQHGRHGVRKPGSASRRCETRHVWRQAVLPAHACWAAPYWHQRQPTCEHQQVSFGSAESRQVSTSLIRLAQADICATDTNAAPIATLVKPQLCGWCGVCRLPAACPQQATACSNCCAILAAPEGACRNILAAAVVLTTGKSLQGQRSRGGSGGSGGGGPVAAPRPCRCACCRARPHDVAPACCAQRDGLRGRSA